MSWFSARPGGQPSIESLVRDHYESLYRFAYRLSGCAADAEDLTQEAFCQAQVKLAQLRDGKSARAWLFTILRNGYLHKVRANKASKTVSLDEVGEVPDRLDWDELTVDAGQLQAALNDLPEPYRTPLILFYFEEFSYRDIAEQLETPMGTVMSRLARAKEFLRGRLASPEPALPSSRKEGV